MMVLVYVRQDSVVVAADVLRPTQPPIPVGWEMSSSLPSAICWM